MAAVGAAAGAVATVGAGAGAGAVATAGAGAGAAAGAALGVESGAWSDWQPANRNRADAMKRELKDQSI